LFSSFEPERRVVFAEAVYSRCVSAMKPQRVEAAKVFKPSNPKFSGDRKQWVADIRKALYASKIISYTQGYMLMRAAAKQHGWNLNNGGIRRGPYWLRRRARDGLPVDLELPAHPEQDHRTPACERLPGDGIGVARPLHTV